MKNIKISFVINIIIVIFTIIGLLVMLTNFKFIGGLETNVPSTPLGRFRLFTIDSNLLMGIVSLLFLINERKVIKKEINEIKPIYYILKLMGTTSVTLTFVIVLFYLGRITSYGLLSLYKNYNLFFHGLIPILSIISFIFFEKTNSIKFRYTFISLVPMIIYSIYYISNILIHMENGKISPIYDFYYFIQNGVNGMIIVIPLIYMITYLIGFTLWYFNKQRSVK